MSSPRKKWKEPEGGYKDFRIGELFDVKKGKRLTKANMLEGCINFIGATSSANGITARIGNEECLHPSGTITVTYNGSVGEAFYQTKPFWASDDVNVLYPKFQMNEPIALFFLAPLSKKGKMYGYSYKWTKEKMEMDSIQLPTTKDGYIDFVFIENCIREIEEEHLCKLETHLQEAGFTDCTLSTEEKEALLAIRCGEKQMRKFAIVKEFKVSNSHNILKSDVVFDSGTTPYVTAGEGDNSIVSYISYKPDMIEQGNSIMIGGKTLVITYQPRDFFSNDSHNLVLTINDERGRNESAQLYMVASLYKTLGPKYSWGDSISKAKIQKDVVFLPITDDGNNIDYVFMETYINAIKKQCIANLKGTIGQENEVIKETSISLDYDESRVPLMAAEDIYIYGSIPVDLPKTNRNELIDENLDLILMYAIPPSGRQKTETAKKIAIGIKESMLSDEQIASYKSVKHLMFHYWSNPKAYRITKEPLLVDRDRVPSDYTIRMEKDAVRFLLLEYDLQNPSELGSIDILKTQRRGEIRYLPFVTTIESIRRKYASTNV